MRWNRTGGIQPWEEAKVLHGRFIIIHEGLWVGIRWRLHPRKDTLEEVETGYLNPFGKVYAD